MLPTTARIIEIVLGAVLAFALGLISKQLQDIKDNRKTHQEAYNKSLEKIEMIEKSVEALRVVVEEGQMRASRYRIIRFDDEEQSGVWHSDDHWDQILEDVDIYSAYTAAHPTFKNHKGQGAMSRIVNANQNGRHSSTGLSTV